MNHILSLEEFVIRGKNSDKVLVFDVDDTIIKSNAHVYVKKDGEIIKRLSSQEYNDYVLADGESFAYDEFRNLDILLDSEIKPYFNTLKREYMRGVHISILTAREGVNFIHDFFMKKANIDIHPSLIFTSDSIVGDYSVSETKAMCIEKLVSLGYKTLVFFDDNVENLREVQKMGKKLGVTIHIVKA